MNSFKQQVSALQKTQQELSSRVKTVESLVRPFKLLTKECIQYLLKYKKKFCYRYLKIWFRSYLGIKDECRILINGEIVRPYHVSLHEHYVHKREKESRYYNQNCSLSSCSADGVDYEYRVLEEKYGSKSALDTIADTNQELSSLLHSIAKDIDSTVLDVQNTISKINGVMKPELRHCGEYLEVSFEAATSVAKLLAQPVSSDLSSKITTSRFTLQSSALRKCTQIAALSTIVEPPSEDKIIMGEPFLPEPVVDRVGDEEQTKKKRRKILDLEDTEDEDEAPKPVPVTKKPIDELLSFGFEVSLDTIKKSFGVPVENVGIQPSASSQILTSRKKLEEETDFIFVGGFFFSLAFPFPFPHSTSRYL
jgi:hypothetical protein